MKNFKLFLISLLLLFFIMGAVSAGDNLTSDNSQKEFYVNDTGDDLNLGSQNSPYATIGKAISDISDSDDVTVHLSKGIFASENDVNFDFNLNHKQNGGSLTFIGQGKDVTFINGQSAFKFAYISKNTNVTLKDLTLIDFKGGNGGTIFTDGVLTMDNCRIENSYSTGSKGGAIYAEGENAVVTVKNSDFVKTSVNRYDSDEFYPQGGGAIFATDIQELYLENNVFENTKLASTGNGRGVGVYSNSKTYMNKNTFVNLEGDSFDGSVFLNTVNELSTLTNNQFINCSTPSAISSIVELNYGKYVWLNNTFSNSQNTLGNVHISGACDNLFLDVLSEIDFNNTSLINGFITPVSVSDDNGNIVTASNVNLKYVGASKTYSYTQFIDDGKIRFSFDEIPQNGIYDVYLGENKVTTLNVALDNDLVEVWVVPNGNDANSGAKNSPYKTIEYAIDKSLQKTFTVIVHVMEGTYTDEGNIGFSLSKIGNVEIIGEDCSKTIFDAQNNDIFMNIMQLNLTVKNVTFTKGYVKGGNLLSGVNLIDCVFENSKAEYIYYEDGSGQSGYTISGCRAYNLTYVNNDGIFSVSDNISNCYFENNKNTLNENGFGFMKISDYNITVSYSKFINNTAKKGGVINIESMYFTSKNNYFEANSAIQSGVFTVSFTDSINFINDVYVGNAAQNYGVVGFNANDYAVPTLIFTNCTFTSNKGSALGLKQAKLKDCTFTDNEGYAIEIIPVELRQEMSLEEITFDNVKFNGNGIYLNSSDLYSYKNYKSDLISLTITFNNLNVKTSSDTLTASVTGPCGAKIFGSNLDFYLNGNRIGSAPIENGISSLKHFGFEMGTYTLTGNTSFNSPSSQINPGNIVVEIDTSKMAEVWVSTTGSDSNDGSDVSPFKTIQHAFDEASKDSTNVVIHIRQGTYSEFLTISSKIDVTLIGDGIDKTIIDGAGASTIAKITEGAKQVEIKDLTIQNANPDNTKSANIASESPITIESANVIFNAVKFTNNHGGNAIIENNGNLTIKNSQMIKNGYANRIISGGNVVIDNSVLNDNFAKSAISVSTLIINNSQIRDNFILNSAYVFINANTKITLSNSKIYNTGNSSEDILGFDGYGNNLLIPFLSLMARDIEASNITLENNINYTSDEAAFIAFGARGGPNMDTAHKSPVNVNVTDSTFNNFQMIWMTNVYDDATRIFDRCIFKNFDAIARSLTEGENPKYNITNSIFLSDKFVIDQIGFKTYEFPNGLDLNNNWWGSNDKPVIVNIQRNGQHTDKTYSPGTWLVLNVKNEVVSFKVTDGTTVSDYTGNIPTDIFDVDLESKVITINGKSYGFTSDSNGDVDVDVEKEVLKPSKTPVEKSVLASDISIYYDSQNHFTANFTTKYGLPLANTQIYFIVQKNRIYAETDENGVATINIDLKPGSYTIDSVNTVTNQIITSTVKVLNPITANKNINMYYGGTNYYSVKIIGNSSGKTVTFTVNKVKYNVNIASNGIATFKNKLQPGTYKITATYAGISVSNTIKVKPILSAKNINSKKQNVKFTVKLVDGKGKIAANKKISVKIDKKTYKVKTNKKGIATVSVKLKKGTHKVVSSYSGTSIKNTIKIK